MGVDFQARCQDGHGVDKCTVLYHQMSPDSMMLCVEGLIGMVECVVNVKKTSALSSILMILTAYIVLTANIIGLNFLLLLSFHSLFFTS